MSRHCTTVWDGCQNELSNLFGVPFGSAYTAAHRSAEIPELMQRGKKRGRNDSSEKGGTQNGAHFYLLCQSGAVQHKGVYKSWCKVRMFGGRVTVMSMSRVHFYSVGGLQTGLDPVVCSFPFCIGVFQSLVLCQLFTF